MEFTSFETPEIVALLNTLDLDMGINSMKVRYMMKIADLNGELVHGYHLRTGVRIPGEVARESAMMSPSIPI